MPASRPTIRFTADRGDTRLRLDQVLVRRVTGISRMSRTQAQHWIETGAVLVNGVAAGRASTRVSEGAVVEVAPPDTAVRKQRPEAEYGALDILYEDDHLIALNKPAGVVVHPSYKHPRNTLLNAVLWHLRDANGGTPAIVTRLDKDTSGVLLVATSGAVQTALQRTMHAGGFGKFYLALVLGRPQPPDGTIALPLARDPHDRRRVVVSAAGQQSITRYRTLRSTDADSLLECELITGRTHQIRVHLSSRGWPIVGDRVYGASTARSDVARQALHAWRVVVTHPVTGVHLEIVAPPPSFLAP
jgi:23S rRNA pseudouridine1911/1915/1917 synthase